MKNTLFIFLSLPCLLFGQVQKSSYAINNAIQGSEEHYTIECEDIDETIINILSIFMNDPGFGFVGCSDVIPFLESQFIIPLNCTTDLTPFGYFNLDVSDICECSCQDHLNIKDPSSKNRKLIKTINILGQETTGKGINIEIYDDGSILKKIIL